MFRTPHGLGSGSTWADGEWSDSDNLLRRVDFWCFSSGYAIAPAGFEEFGIGGRAMIESALLRFIGSGTLLVCDDLHRHSWPRSRTSCCRSKLSSWMTDEKVDSQVFLPSLSAILWSVSTSCIINVTGDISHPQYDAQWWILGWETLDGQQRLETFLNVTGLSRCASRLFSE